MWAIGQASLMKRPFNLFHRRNLNLRTREVPRNFGNKTTWERPFPKLFKRFIYEANSVVFDNGKKNHVSNEDALLFKKINFDFVYFDPPYFHENQRDTDYRDIYHFLEGLSDYKNWEEKINWNSTNRNLNCNVMKWPKNSKIKLEEIYKDLIERFQNSTILISHKSNGIISQSYIIERLSKIGKSIKVWEQPYNYALSKSNGKAKKNIELLILGY